MKAVVCGAGIAGLAVANRLTDIGWEVVVLEKAPGPRTQGYMIDFFGPGYDAAAALGVLPRLLELRGQVEDLSYVDALGKRRGGLSFARFAATVGGRLLSIMRPDLEMALRERLSTGVRFSSPVTAVADGAVTTASGDVHEADLVIGADGIHSTVRTLTFGGDPLRHLGFHTAAFIFDDPVVHARVAGRFCVTDTVDRQMGLYGLRDGRVAAFTAHRTTDRELPADPAAALRSVYGGMGWVVPRVLSQLPAEIYYDHVAQVELPEWSRGRVTLVGDACGAVSLLAGQGASLGLAGGYVLAERLRSLPVARAVAAYEREWRPVVTEKQEVARRAMRWFLPRSPMELRLRRLSMRLSGLPGVDRLVAAAVAGKPTALAA
jgi:2-polyprenyl-6-methoxyphenol hydroxylase-like FAD-dependent oxidoreductase